MRIKKILCKTVAVVTTAALLTGYGSVLDTEASEYESDSEEIVVIEEETDSEETSEDVTTEETSEDVTTEETTEEVSEVVVEEEAKSASLMATSEDDFEYDLLDDGTIEITDYTGSDAEIEIPSTIDGYKVTRIDSWSFWNSSLPTSIKIPEGVTSIGNYAFGSCKNLTSVEIPGTVTSIEDDAFNNCPNLTSIEIPDSVTSIGSCVFENCTNLASIEIPDSVTSIDSDLLVGTAYYNDESNWTDGVLYINNWLIEAKEDEIAGTYTIKEGTIGIAGAAFYGCEDITNINIPDSVQNICRQAFEYCTSLTSIIIPEGVTKIEEWSFYKCTVLESINIPDSVQSIGQNAFTYCRYLTSIEIPDGVTIIEKHTFGGCSNLANVKIPDTVTCIDESAFSGCIALKSIEIPDSVTSIGTDAFYGCSILESIYYSGSQEQWNKITFGNSWNSDCSDNLAIYYNGKLVTPTLKSATNTTSGVKVTWSAVTGATKYQVYRKTSGGSWAKLGTSTSTSYTDKTAKSGTTYYYTVRCMNSSGTYTSDYNTSGISRKYLSRGKISSLTNKSSGITIKWSKVTGASGYYIYRKTSSGSYSKIKTITSGSTLSYTDTKVKSKNGTTYVYKVVPYSGSTTGSFTAKTTVRLTGTSLSSVKNSSSKKMTVKWSKKSSITGYQIQYSTSSSFSSYKTVTVSGASKISKVISSLTKNKTYYVRIRTYKTVNGTKYYSAWSSKKSVKIKK